MSALVNSERMEAGGHESTSHALWKRIVIRALVGGVGFALALSLIVLSVYLYVQRPKSWNTHAVRAMSAKAEALSRLGDHLEELSSGTDFTVDLENATDEDINLSPALRVMQSSKAGGTLHGSQLKLDREYFPPARHVVSVSLDNSDLCAAKFAPQKCYDAYFVEDHEIIIFDGLHRYEIHIPIPPFTPPKNGAIRFRAAQ